MIERLRLQNFQGHVDLKLVLDPAINCIVGRTDSGKSSIIRALRWLALNRPTGNEFIRDGADAATVTLWVDGRRVSRRRGKSDNAYTLDATEYRAFGQDVPPDVLALLAMGDLSFQQQHDAPFWLGLSPPEVARQLNAVVDLTAIDACLAYLVTAGRRAAAEIAVVEDRLAKAASAAEDLAWAPALDADLTALEQREARMASLVAQAGLCGALTAEAESLAALAADAATRAEGALAGITELDRLVGVAQAAVGELGDLRGLIDLVLKGIEGVGWAAQQADIAQAELDALTGGLCPVCGGPLENSKINSGGIQ